MKPSTSLIAHRGQNFRGLGTRRLGLEKASYCSKPQFKLWGWESCRQTWDRQSQIPTSQTESGVEPSLSLRPPLEGHHVDRRQLTSVAWKSGDRVPALIAFDLLANSGWVVWNARVGAMVCGRDTA